MKTLSKIVASAIILFTVASHANVFGQESTDSLSRQLVGTWSLTNATKDSLFFKKQSDELYIWGDKIEINRNGRFTDSYLPSCGLDTRGHVDKGRWKIKDTGEFITTIPVCLGLKKHKVVALTNQTLILQKIE